MKQHQLFPVLFLLFFYTPILSWACQNSDISLVSFTDNGTSFDYAIQVCSGGGILGSTTGANGPTRAFSLSLAAGGNTVTVSNLSPITVTSVETMVTMNISIQGPQGPPFNADALIFYAPTSSDPFTCITSTVLCGQPYADCHTISFTTDVELTSITANGIEGNGSPTGGCTGDPDMKIDFVSVPVELIHFAASTQDATVLLEWETVTEIDNDYFTIERSTDGKIFQALGRVAGNHTTSETKKYQFVDKPQQMGQYYYRLKQVDFSGEFSYGPIVSTVLNFGVDRGLYLYPNPTASQLHVISPISISSSSVAVEIYNRVGQLVKQEVHDWTGQLTLPTDIYQPGIYQLRLYANKQLIGEQRFVKL
ncbi:MAG: T9SS type A sorting domain-containing protein [Bacteroidota bacterium]